MHQRMCSGCASSTRNARLAVEVNRRAASAALLPPTPLPIEKIYITLYPMTAALPTGPNSGCINHTFNLVLPRIHRAPGRCPRTPGARNAYVVQAPLPSGEIACSPSLYSRSQPAPPPYGIVPEARSSCNAFFFGPCHAHSIITAANMPQNPGIREIVQAWHRRASIASPAPLASCNKR